MPTWTSLSVFKARLSITVTTWDTAIEAVLDGVESTIASMIGSPVLQDASPRTEYYDGVVGTELKLTYRPVVKTGLLVYVDQSGDYGDNPAGGFSSATLLTLGTDYNLLDVRGGYSKSGILVRMNGIWPSMWYRPPNDLASTLVGARGAVKVVYSAGWALADIPPALIQAAYAEATMLYSMFIGTGKSGQQYNSESLNGYSYSQGIPTGLKADGYGPSRLINPTAVAMIGGLGLIDPVIA